MSDRGTAGRLTKVLDASRGAHREDLVPHPGPTPEPRKPLGAGGRSGALRAAIFGVNDGLVSNLSLIMGVAGAAVDNHIVLLAGVAGLIAGAFSMGAGEYISMRVQRELFERLIHIEAHELATEPDLEHRELQQIYEKRGFPPELARQVTDVVMQNPEVALETHAREELGLVERLGHEVVGAQPQGQHAIVFARRGAANDDRHVVAATNRGAQHESVRVR